RGVARCARRRAAVGGDVAFGRVARPLARHRRRRDRRALPAGAAGRRRAGLRRRVDGLGHPTAPALPPGARKAGGRDRSRRRRPVAGARADRSGLAARAATSARPGPPGHIWLIWVVDGVADVADGPSTPVPTYGDLT